MNRAVNMAAGEDGASEFMLSDADFSRICELVREQSGIALTEAKRQMVYGRLVRRVRALRLAGFGEYLQLLERGDQVELQEFTNAITTNLTSFFREIHHFEYLANAAAAGHRRARARHRAAAHLVECLLDRRGGLQHRDGAAGAAGTARTRRCQDPGDRPGFERARDRGGRHLSRRARTAGGGEARGQVLQTGAAAGHRAGVADHCSS